MDRGATLAIRREDRLQERRCPIAPAQVRELRAQGIEVVVQAAPQRTFSDDEYRAADARLEEDLRGCRVVCGIKEIALDQLEPDTTYLFFSHTIKGQAQNRPLLQRLIELGCTLIDYERITDGHGQRLVFFGRFAGYAGMVDSLWALGQRLAAEGIATPLGDLLSAQDYAGLAAAREAVREVGRAWRQAPLPESIQPLVIGVAGCGNAGSGAWEILGDLGAETITPEALLASRPTAAGIYRTQFDVHHLVHALDGSFELAEYFKYPHRYRSNFARFLPHLNVLMNCIYWEERYPRLVRLTDLHELFRDAGSPPRLRVIGDVSCDVGGAIQATLRATWPDNPVYVYDVSEQRTIDGVVGHGPVIMAVYNLPAELPRDASEAFGRALVPFLPAIARADYSAPLDRCGLPDEILRAVIVHQGDVTPDYEYLAKYL